MTADIGVKTSQLLQCGQCANILDLNVTLTSDTPGAELTAVVIATLPCVCGHVARTVVRVGGTE